MEENQNSSLFGLGIDNAAKAHLAEAARWAKFLAIVGFIIIGLLIIFGAFAGSMMASLTGGFRNNELGQATGMMTSFLVVVYIIFGIIYFFPCLFLFRFASKMKTALASDDQPTLNTSFQNLKIMFRYVGILTIIGLAFYAIVICVALLGAGLSR